MLHSGTMSPTARPGRRPATDHAAIEAAAFALFARQGFEATSLEQIADAVGVGRRTLFRYYPSKNDIAWGEFDRNLEQLRADLAATDPAAPLAETVHAAVVAFNAYDEAVEVAHRIRMELILHTPALQAHSALRYAAWREVIAEHVAGRLGLEPTDAVPRLAGHLSLALAVSSYEEWLARPGSSLTEILAEALDTLRGYLAR